MELKIKSIDMPQVQEEGSDVLIDLYILNGQECVGRTFVSFPFSDDFMSMTLGEISSAAITKAADQLR